MKSIGIRELRQNAGVWLRRVQEGESVQITDRGRPVAMLVPLREMSERDRLIAEGRLIPAKRSIRDLGPPVSPKPGVPLPSEILEQMRGNER